MIGWTALAVFLQTATAAHKTFQSNTLLGQTVHLSPVVPKGFNTRDIYWKYVSSREELVLSSSRGTLEKLYRSRFLGRVHLRSNSTLEIQSLDMGDSGMFTCMLVDIDGQMAQWTFHLKVYEAVEQPVVTVFISDREALDEECTVFLRCATIKGSNVSYSWRAETGHLVPTNTAHNTFNDGRLLRVVLMPTDRNISFTCTVSNPVSQNHTTVVPWDSCPAKAGAAAHNWKLVPFIAVSIIVGLTAGILCVMLFIRASGKKREGARKTEEAAAALQQVLEAEDLEQPAERPE